MRIGAIIQARTSSTRLPAKVLKELPYNSGATVLQQVVRRLKRSHMINKIIVATTTDKEDRSIVRIAETEEVAWFRGSKEDVLERYYLAAVENSLDVVVRITSDCPCIDPEIVDQMIAEHIIRSNDFTSNVLVKTFPHGLETEVMNFNTLKKACLEAKDRSEREHVTPYIYITRPDLFKISGFEAPAHLSYPDIRITIDTEEDYALLCAVYEYLYPKNEFFITKDIIALIREKPWLTLINKKIIQKDPSKEISSQPMQNCLDKHTYKEKSYASA